MADGLDHTTIDMGHWNPNNEGEKQLSHKKGAVSGQTLYYPLDLNSQSFYPESIKFTVYERHGASLAAIKQTISDLATTASNAFNNIPDEKKQETVKALIAERASATDDRVKNIDAKLKELLAGSGNLFELITGPVSTAVKDIFTETTKGLNQKTISQLQSSDESMSQLAYIYLNMPNEIAFSDEVSWTGTDLGVVGGLTKGGAGGGILAGFFNNFSNVIGGGTGALTSMLLKLPGGALGGGIIGSLGGEGLQKALESGTGQIANPYKEMTFSGIGFRNFFF